MRAGQGASNSANLTGRKTTYMTIDCQMAYAEVLVEHLKDTESGINACNGKGKSMLAFVSGVVQSRSEHPPIACFVCSSLEPGMRRDRVQAGCWPSATCTLSCLIQVPASAMAPMNS